MHLYRYLPNIWSYFLEGGINSHVTKEPGMLNSESWQKEFMKCYRKKYLPGPASHVCLFTVSQ